MTIADDTGRNPALPTFGKPSLMGGPGGVSTPGETTQPLRMLDALGDVDHGPRAVAPSRVRLWLLALSMTMLAVAAFSWWQQRDEATAQSSDAGRSTPGIAPVPTPTPTATALPRQAPPESSAPIILTAPSTGPASIERSAEPDPLLASSRSQGAVASSAVRLPKPVAAVARRAGNAPTAAPRTNVAVTSERRRKSEPATAHGRKVVTAKATPRSGTSTRPVAPASTRDPDVTLLSAMLARLSSDHPGDAATIAQLVGRCEARRGSGSSEALECRRQICAGHWGKVDACPTSAAQKRN